MDRFRRKEIVSPISVETGVRCRGAVSLSREGVLFLRLHKKGIGSWGVGGPGG